MQLEYYLRRTISLKFPVQRKIHCLLYVNLSIFLLRCETDVYLQVFTLYVQTHTRTFYAIFYIHYITHIYHNHYICLYICIIFICESVMHNVYICSWNILTARNILTACFSNCSPDMCSPSEFSCILTAFTYFWIFYLLVPYYTTNLASALWE